MNKRTGDRAVRGRGEGPGLARHRDAVARRRARQRDRHPAVQVDGARSPRREPPKLRLVLHESHHSRARPRRRGVARGRCDDAALGPARRSREALGRVVDRARRVRAGPGRRARRSLDAARPRHRRPRRRPGTRRRGLRLPRADRRREALRPSPDARARLLGRGRAMNAMRILVVEDDERLAEIFRDFIAELGYQPIVVGSAEAGLEALTSARPDTILLDVRLPGMSGVEFLSLPVVRDSEVPVVVVSGVATEIEARACLKLGALDFIRKPVTLEFTPPDGGPPIDVLALVVRVDTEGAAFWFLDLMTHDIDRLNTLVDR